MAPTIFPRVGYSTLSVLMFNTVLSIFNNSLAIAVMLRNPALLQPIFILSLAVSASFRDQFSFCVCVEFDFLFHPQTISVFSVKHLVKLSLPESCVRLSESMLVFLHRCSSGLVSLCTLTLLAYER